MKLFKVLTGVVVAAAAVVAVNTASASATSAAPLCTVKEVHMSQWTKSFKFNGDKVTATFTLEGAANCKYQMTLAAFEGPKGIHPVRDQKLFSYASGTFGKGTHTLTTTYPDCFYQLDLFTGAPLPGETTQKGTRYNDFVNGGTFVNMGKWYTNGNTARLIDFYEGGKVACEKPEEPKDLCPNIAGKQGEIPEGHEVDGKGNCVVPEEPKEEKPEVKGEQTPTVLPETGAGAVAAFAGVSTIAGAAHAAIRRLRK